MIEASGFRIPCSHKDVFTLWNFFDVHLDSADCDTATFKRDIKSVIADDKAYAIFGGDTFDMMFAKNDPRGVVGNINPEIGDTLRTLDKSIEYACDILSPLAKTGRLIGMLEGNHESEFAKRYKTHVVSTVCDKLGIRYLGYCHYVRFYFAKQIPSGKPSTVCAVTGYFHHGHGGNASETKGTLSLQRTRRAHSADFYVYGHIHQNIGYPFIRECVRGTEGNEYVVETQGCAIMAGTYKKAGAWENSKGMEAPVIGAGILYFYVHIGNNVMLVGVGRNPIEARPRAGVN